MNGLPAMVSAGFPDIEMPGALGTGMGSHSISSGGRGQGTEFGVTLEETGLPWPQVSRQASPLEISVWESPVCQALRKMP